MKISIRKSIVRSATLASSALILTAGLVGCGSEISNTQQVSTPQGMCAYLIGNGNASGGNRTVNKIVYPGETAKYNSDFDSPNYFPCGPRNFVVAENSGDEEAGGKTLLDARTKTGTQVRVSLSAYWTPNRGSAAVEDFITLCAKYNCASQDLNGNDGDTNFSSPGWNGMLRENLYPALQRSAASVLPTISDEIWIQDDAGLKKDASDAISFAFADELAKTTGASEPLFCGSGSTGNSDDFECADVRIVVDKVVAANSGLQTQTDEQLAKQRQIDLENNTAEARIALSDRLYGPLAAQIRACEDRKEAICVIGGQSVQVSIPR